MGWDLDFPGLAYQRRWYLAGLQSYRRPTWAGRSGFRPFKHSDRLILCCRSRELLLGLGSPSLVLFRKSPQTAPMYRMYLQGVWDFRSNRRCQGRRLEIDVSKRQRVGERSPNKDLGAFGYTAIG
ncbi:hypothetical protein PIB30_001631 [Stylosanthes scabra]|uniref:Uncharacterized protein n=1 Tax=Stylosanthes scabra TaxID=79078 RepID=A0ABU6T2W7_9FABA|nr:hypothetical protein [Stylosanthes scabra]